MSTNDDLETTLLDILQEQDGRSTASLCRAVNSKFSWCTCSEYQNPRKRAKGYPSEECDLKFSKVRRTLNKLIFSGQAISIRSRVEDKGQARGWDVMTIYYLWDSEILPNPSQKSIRFTKQKVLEL